MDVSLVRFLHLFATALLFAAIFGLTFYVVRGRRTGQLDTVAACVRRARLIGGPLLLVCLVILPVSGWWLVHLNEWPLQQTWLLAGSGLFLLGCLCGLLMWRYLTAAYRSMPSGLPTEEPSAWPTGLDRALIKSLCCLSLALLCLLIALVLMFGKPV